MLIFVLRSIHVSTSLYLFVHPPPFLSVYLSRPIRVSICPSDTETMHLVLASSWSSFVWSSAFLEGLDWTEPRLRGFLLLARLSVCLQRFSGSQSDFITNLRVFTAWRFAWKKRGKEAEETFCSRFGVNGQSMRNAEELRKRFARVAEEVGLKSRGQPDEFDGKKKKRTGGATGERTTSRKKTLVQDGAVEISSCRPRIVVRKLRVSCSDSSPTRLFTRCICRCMHWEGRQSDQVHVQSELPCVSHAFLEVTGENARRGFCCLT